MNAELSREIMSLQFFGLKNRINKQLVDIGNRFIPPRYAYLSVLGGCWIKVGQTYSGKRFVVKDDDSVFTSSTSSSTMAGTVTFQDTFRSNKQMALYGTNRHSMWDIKINQDEV